MILQNGEKLTWEFEPVQSNILGINFTINVLLRRAIENAFNGGVSIMSVNIYDTTKVTFIINSPMSDYSCVDIMTRAISDYEGYQYRLKTKLAAEQSKLSNIITSTVKDVAPVTELLNKPILLAGLILGIVLLIKFK